MRNRLYIVAIMIISAALLCSAGCAKKQIQEEPLPGIAPGAGTEDGGAAAAGEGALVESTLGTGDFREVPADNAALLAIFTDIPFDFDDFSLRPEATKTLKSIAQWMLTNTAAQLLIEGHCDERGTSEYNLALGERRANSAKKYLVQLGINPDRIATISYGEEKPLDPGHNETAWARNRRGHFLIR